MIKLKGVLLAGLAAALWAISGLAGQLLFSEYGFQADWLVSVRMIFSGVLLLSIGSLSKTESIFKVFKNKQDFLSLLLFSIFGMLAVQLTYFKTIEASNAAFATIIQYTGPFFVILYHVVKDRLRLSLSSWLLLLTTAFGVLLIATKGDSSNLSVSVFALLWGIGSAIALAFYSIQPKQLLDEYGSLLTVGWGMLIGGGISNVIKPVWKLNQQLSLEAILLIGVVVLFGTALAYLLYLSSLAYISPALASTLTAFEPGLAAVLTVLIFKVPMTIHEILGFLLILTSILWLQKKMA